MDGFVEEVFKKSTFKDSPDELKGHIFSVLFKYIKHYSPIALVAAAAHPHSYLIENTPAALKMIDKVIKVKYTPECPFDAFGLEIHDKCIFILLNKKGDHDIEAVKKAIFLLFRAFTETALSFILKVFEEEEPSL